MGPHSQGVKAVRLGSGAGEVGVESVRCEGWADFQGQREGLDLMAVR